MPHSLVQRVVLSLALGSLLAGSVVAVVTVVLADHLASEQEDNHLLEAARTLAFELRTKNPDPFYVAADEARELAHTGIMVALFEAGHYLAGDAKLPFVAPEQCQSTASSRVCAVSAGRWVSAAGREHTRLAAHAELTLTAAGIALLITGLLSTGLAFFLASAVVKPLDKLNHALRQLPVNARTEPDLGPASGTFELDTLRASLLAAFAAVRGALDRSRSFTGNAAHQLRTPLATLIGELDLALEVVTGETREECVRAQHAAERLSTLIDRLLILANPDDSLQVSIAVSLSELIANALELLPPAARARIACNDSSIMVNADPTLLLTAIVAALERALARTSGRVRVHSESDTQSARLTIASPDSSELTQSKEADLLLDVVTRVTALHGGSVRRGSSQLELTLPRQLD